MRVSYSGSTTAFQAVSASSILATRNSLVLRDPRKILLLMLCILRDKQQTRVRIPSLAFSHGIPAKYIHWVHYFAGQAVDGSSILPPRIKNKKSGLYAALFIFLLMVLGESKTAVPSEVEGRGAACEPKNQEVKRLWFLRTCRRSSLPALRLRSV